MVYEFFGSHIVNILQVQQGPLMKNAFYLPIRQSNHTCENVLNGRPVIIGGGVVILVSNAEILPVLTGTPYQDLF